MFRVYYYGLHRWENYLLDIDDSVKSSGEKTRKLAHETSGLRETVRSGFENLRSSIEDLHNGIEDMRADFQWGFSLLADRMDAQISIMAGIANKLDTINSTLGAPLDTQARELYRIGVARLRDGLDDKALEAFLKSEQKNDVDFALQLYIGKLYLYGKDVINLQKATEHLLLAARYAEAKRGRLDNWNRYAAEAYFHAAVSTYIEGESAIKDGNHRDVSPLLQKSLGFLAKASSLYPEFLEVIYFRAKCCALLGKDAEVIECFEALVDRDRRYFLKAAEDKDFDNVRSDIIEVADYAIANPGPLAQKIITKFCAADEALLWAKRNKSQSSDGFNGADLIAERIANTKSVFATLEADLVAMDLQLDIEIASAL